MINDKNKKQEAGDGSSNVQAENINVYNGISYSDAKEIFQDLFENNFLKLKSEAANVAQERAEHITEKFLGKLKQESPDSLNEFEKPAMQDALFTVQKEYAKSGDENLEDLLIDILVDRTKTQDRNMLQLVLDESLKIAPFLTVKQLDTLTLGFILNRTQWRNIGNFNEFKQRIEEDVAPFAENILTEYKHYNYLEFQRCGQIRTGNFGKLENNFVKRYKGIFSKGITQDEIETVLGEPNPFSSLLMPCLHDQNLFQISTLNDEVLDEQLEKLGVSQELKPKFKMIFNKSTMEASDVKNLLIESNPCFEKLFDVMDSSMFNRFELSSVGIAIAHANYRRRTGKTMDLSKWIN